jgi:uncharacterized delta-60 repeat protein
MPMKSRKITFFILFIISVCNAQMPAPGTLDTNFGNSGSVNPPVQKNLIPYSINVQPKTGEIITAGNYRNASGKTIGFIGRYDFQGKPKTNFGINGILEVFNLSNTSQNIYKAYFESSEPDSPIYIRGRYTDNGTSIYYISKYLSNGSLDTSYGTNGSIIGIKGQIHGNYIYSLRLNTTTQHQSFNRYHLADGSLDTSFNNGDLPFLNSQTTFYSDQYETINIQADGKIILCGHSGQAGIVARYDNTGHIDTTFGTNGYYYTTLTSLAPDIFYTKTQSDGKIIFLNSNYYTGISSPVLGRLNSNGTLDTTYGSLGYFKYDFNFSGTYIDDIKIQSDNKIVFCGSIVINDSNRNSVIFLARVSNTGTLDFWRNDLESTYSENWSLALIKDSYLLSFGNSTSEDFSKTFPVIQKTYLKVPEISLNGSSLSSDITDLVLSTSDGITYSKDNVVLSAGDIKFRLDQSDDCYWGAATSSPFPSGISTMGAEKITINTSGTYNVNFNIKTGAYNFTNITLGLGNNNAAQNELLFYPNPAKEKITFNKNLESINIFSSEGKLMNSSSMSNEINISNLPKGIYYFQILTENKSIIGNKFIKE